jgi:hypothetical protein
VKVLDARIKMLDRKGLKPHKGHNDVKGAFVTFNQPMSHTIALDIYRSSGYWLTRLFQPRGLRMRQKCAITVEQACEPSDVQWENIGEGYWSLFYRRSISNLCVLSALAISFGFISYVASLQAAVKASTLTYKDQCAHHLPATMYGSYEAVPMKFKLRLVDEEERVRMRQLQGTPPSASDNGRAAAAPGGGPRGLSEDELEERPLSVAEQEEQNRLAGIAADAAWTVQMQGIFASTIATDCATEGGRLFAYDPPPVPQAVFAELVQSFSTQEDGCQHGSCGTHNGLELCAPFLSYCGNSLGPSLPGCWNEAYWGEIQADKCYFEGTCVPVDCDVKAKAQYCPVPDGPNQVVAMCDTSAAVDEVTGTLLHETRTCAKIGCLDRLRRDFPERLATLAFDQYGCEDFTESAATGCFCYARLLELVELEGPMLGAKTLMAERDGLCYTIAEQYALSASAQLFSGFIIAIINTVVVKILVSVSNFERWNTISGQASALCTRIFIACFINTSLLLVLCQGKIPTITSPAQFSVGDSSYGLLIGEHQDFDWKWYPAVGTAIITAMFANIFMPHLPFAFYHYISHPLSRWFKLKFMRHTIVTQGQMNHVFACPDFQLETRLPVALNTIYSALLFSGGMPILIPFAACTLMLQSTVDKYGVLRVYQRPSRMGPEVMQQATRLLPMAILLHLAMSIWAFSNVEVREHNADFNYKPPEPTPAPLPYNATLGNVTSYNSTSDLMEEEEVDFGAAFAGRDPPQEKSPLEQVLIDGRLTTLASFALAGLVGLLVFLRVIQSPLRMLYGVWKVRRAVDLVYTGVGKSGYSDDFELNFEADAVGSGAGEGMELVEKSPPDTGGEKVIVPDYTHEEKKGGWFVLQLEEEGWQRRNRETAVRKAKTVRACLLQSTATLSTPPILPRLWLSA